MALFDNAMVIAANALRSAITHMQIHSGDPGTAGTSNNLGAARQAISWTSATADGDFGLASAANFTGLTAGATCTWISVWSAVSAGTCYGRFQLTGDTTANASGEFTVSALNLNGSAS